MTDPYWTIGEFARQVGVSVRTLQYYDNVDLLKPTAYSQTGRRLYSKSDIPRLQQIITLKFIGLSLEEIRVLLNTDSVDFDDLIHRQKSAIQEKVRQLQRVITTLDRTENVLCGAENIDLQQFIAIIREVQMSNQTDWFTQFFTDKQQEKISELMINRDLESQRAEGKSLQNLFADIEAYLAGEPDKRAEQELARRWQQLIQAHVLGNKNLQTSIETAYTQITAIAESLGLSDDAQVWIQSMQDAATFASSFKHDTN